MYLFGSLANGDFDQYSDIDVLIVTDGELANDTFLALQEMHTEIAKIDSPWAAQQEVSYICLLYTPPSPRDRQKSRMPSSA